MPVIGSAFAKKRYEKYKNIVSWDGHSEYKTLFIERAYILRTSSGEPKAIGLYRAKYASTDAVIVGTTLDEIRSSITEFRIFGSVSA